jgi:hypothetical protein
VLDAAAASGATLLPVDSEHNAIFQALGERPPESVSKIILTASGGPFREASLAEMRAATPEQAVRHPVWSMGAKISVDSATMFNKGLEVIEAARLFPGPPIEVLIHPQSTVHGLVQVPGRLGAGAARQPGHAHADRPLPGLAEADGGGREAAGPRGARPARLRGARRRALPCPAAVPRGAGDRRRRALRVERGE